MAKVIVKDNSAESLDKAIKQLRKKVEQEGILKEYRNRMYYKSKGVLRREKAKAGRRKQLKQMRKQAIFDKRFD